MPSTLPPLPSHLITAILSHLLPPSPPLPPDLIGRDLLERLKYLPPGPDDSDPWLSPFPSPSPNFLRDRLEMLSTAHEIGKATYASDGESNYARVPIKPVYETTTDEGDDGGVDVLFTHEQGEKGRGWVYHASQPSAKSSELAWQSDPDLPVTPPSANNGEDHVSVADYWKDFSPPTTHPDLPIATEEETEDAYWASYGATASGAATPGAGILPRNMSKDDLGRRTPGGHHGTGKEGRVLCDLPKTQTGALDPLAALLSTLPDRLAAADEEDEEPSAPPRELVDYRDKIRGRILASLREAWSEYIRDVEAKHEALEEKAHGWLRIGRSVVDGTPGAITFDSSELVARAKLEVLRDLYTTATASDERDPEAFWRHIESAIKMPMNPGLSAEAMGMTQETYWE